MRAVRTLLVVLWTIASLTGVGAAASACEHGANDARAAAVMDHGGPMADHPGTAGHGHAAEHDPGACCEQDCCEGACACEGLASAAAILPGSDASEEPPTDAKAERLDALAEGLTAAAEGPPPRA